MFPSGVSTVTFPIIPVNDAIAEGTEKITLTFQSVNPCGSQASTKVNLYIEDLTPVVLSIADTSICLGQTITLTANVSGGGSGPYTYLWSTGSITNSIIVTPAISTTYWCSASVKCGANAYTDSVKVTVLSNSKVTISLDVPNSPVDTVFREGCDSLYIRFNRGMTNLAIAETFPVLVSGTASGGLDYSASLPASITFTPGQSQLTLGIKSLSDGITEGMESLIITIPGNSCNPLPVSAKAYLSDNPSLTINPSPNVNLPCPGNSTTMSVTVVGGISSYSYSWSPGASTGSTQTVSPASTTTYTVVIKDVFCPNLIAQAFITISVPSAPPLNATIAPAFIRCPGEVGHLVANISGGFTPYSYLWSNGLTTKDISVIPAQTTTYTLIVTDACNFYSDTLTTSVSVWPYLPLQLNTINDTNICFGEKIALHVNANMGTKPYRFIWENNYMGQTYSVSPTNETVYHVKVVDSCGNSAYDSVKVKVVEVKASFSYEFLDDNAVMFTNLSTGNQPLLYTWNYHDHSPLESTMNPTHLFPSSMEAYSTQLIAYTPEGCKDIVSHPLYPPYELWIPNAFTPGTDDKLNEVFKAYGIGVSQFKLSVFDRWGNSIFETHDLLKGWDGTLKGELCPSGVYIYIITAAGFKPGNRTYKAGQVSLIR